MLNPTDLITFGADNSGLSNLGVLLSIQRPQSSKTVVISLLMKGCLTYQFAEKVEETGAEVEMVIEEGLTLRRKLIDDE